MHFEQKFKVDPISHYIHNCFAPKEFTVNLHIKGLLPPGYKMAVLGIDLKIPERLGDKFEFVFREGLLPEQVIEYIIEKEA